MFDEGATSGPARRLPRNTMALVLAGGRGTRLEALTEKRAKPAVHFGGKYRIIDFALSNCINSGIRRIAVLTQYKAHSLLRHLQRGWSWLRHEVNEFVEIWPAMQSPESDSWYKGTADAIWQNIDIVEAYGAQYALILAGDHVYKMDYGAMIQEHADSDTDVTVGCVEVSQEEGAAFGIMHVDDRDKVVDFLEKPADPPAMPDKPGRCLASMGIYVFSLQFLRQVLAEDAADETSSHDFGKDVIPRVVRHGIVRAHRFEKSCIKSDAEAESYWRDVGTVDAYWAANIDLAGVTPALDLYDATWPIYSYQEQLPSAKFVHDREGRRGMALDSLVSAGCIISGGTVRQSLLFNRVRVNSYAELGRAVILPGVDIGRSARLRNAIVDRGVHIPEGLVVGEDPDLDAARFHRTKKGVTLITEPMINALER